MKEKEQREREREALYIQEAQAADREVSLTVPCSHCNFRGVRGGLLDFRAAVNSLR